MSDIIDALKIAGGAISAISNASKTTRITTALHFKHLSEIFGAFPEAWRNGDGDQMQRLVGKTAGTLSALEQTNEFRDSLGDNANDFFDRIRRVLIVKIQATSDPIVDPDQISDIIKAAGFFEGYAEVFSAIAGKTEFD